MKNKNNNLVFFGSNFVDKKEEPLSTAENEFIQDWYDSHSDIFEDEHKRYHAIHVMNLIYYRDGWLQLEDQENFLELFFAEAEKRINRLFNNPKARENKVSRLTRLYQLMKNKKKKKFKIKRSVITNTSSKDEQYTVSQTEIIYLT